MPCSFPAHSWLQTRVVRASAFDNQAGALGRAGPWLVVIPALILPLSVFLLARAERSDADLLREAHELAKAGRFDQASIVLAGLRIDREVEPPERLLRAQIATAQVRVSDALVELGRIPDDHPLAPLAQLSVGQLEARRGRLRPAEAAFRKAIALESGSTQARRELVYIYTTQLRFEELDRELRALAASAQLDAKHLLHWGMIHHVKWAAGTDLHALEKYLDADPDDRATRLALAQALRRVARADEALDCLAPLPESDLEAQAIRVEIALDEADLGRAEALLATCPAEDPALARLRGSIAIARNDPALAIRHLEIARKAAPDDRATLQALASAYTLGGEPARAKPLRERIQLHDEYTQLISRANASQGEWDRDLALLLGKAAMDLGRVDQARAWFRLVLETDPLNSEAQESLAKLKTQSTPSPP